MNDRWTYDAGWHRGFAAGVACAFVVALAVVFVLLAFDTFDKPIPQLQMKGTKNEKAR